MKRYLKNLMIALCGSDPYQAELDRAKEEYRKTAEKIAGLEETFYKVRVKMAEDAGQITSLQNLVEQLRGHLDEKDQLMDRMKKEYQRRIEEYNIEIGRLKLKEKCEQETRQS